MKAAILTVGSELTSGQIADTNAQWVAGELFLCGVEVVLIISVDDLRDKIADAVTCVRSRAGFVWITGGLGPTRDDVTVESVSRALGRGLVEDAGTAERIRRWHAMRGRVPTAESLRQALVPEGARVLVNPVGTAPGIILDDAGCTYVILPGVPVEMKTIAEESVLPGLRACGSPAASRIYRTAGIPEGMVDEHVRDIWKGLREGERFALQVEAGEVILRVCVSGEHEEQCKARLEGLDVQIRGSLGDSLVSADGSGLAARVVSLLRVKGWKLALAESVTGGLVMGRLTSVPGASGVVRGGWVVYRDEAKTEWLGVDRRIVEAHGAVSPETARAMACAALERGGSSIALSTTGWAGPDGGSERDPVGTVYTGVATEGEVSVHRHVYRSDRWIVREHATTTALDLLRRVIQSSP